MWIDVLLSLVKRNWSSTGKALLLSKVKFELEQEGVDLDEALNGRKLKDAILEDGDMHLQLVRHPERPLVWAVLPNDVELPEEIASLFREPEKKRSSSSEKPRFRKGVWLAFAKPIRPETRRYLEIGPPSKFVDVPNDGIPPEMGVEVEQRFIYGSSTALAQEGDRERVIEEKIREWAADKEIEIARLTFYGARSSIQSVRISNQQSQFDYLDFSALTLSDKSRISIPLDLLPKIRFGRRP